MARKVALGVLISETVPICKRSLTLSKAVSLTQKSDRHQQQAGCSGPCARAAHQIPTQVVDHHSHPDREVYDKILTDTLQAQQVELVILAGFMRLLSPLLCARIRIGS
jgi:folate-dependent phosphoribosylglycinamide formyltransferase PurN